MEARARNGNIEDLRAAAPLVTEAPRLDGGTQSLADVREGLQCDEDGDEAHGFLVVDEPAPAPAPAAPRPAG